MSHKPTFSDDQGYRAMRAAPDAITYSPDDFIEKTTLPPKVDLRPLMSAVENQGQTSSCVANAVAGAYEYWFRCCTMRTTM